MADLYTPKEMKAHLKEVKNTQDLFTLLGQILDYLDHEYEPIMAESLAPVPDITISPSRPEHPTMGDLWFSEILPEGDSKYRAIISGGRGSGKSTDSYRIADKLFKKLKVK